MNTKFFPRRLLSQFSPSLKIQRGFTMIDTVVSSIIGITILAGSWIAFGNYSMEARIANADRQMDQYASSAMKEIVNTLSDSWGGQPLRSGRFPLWRFYVGDGIGEYAQKWTDPQFTIYSTDNLHYIFLNHNANEGILINYNSPDWASDGRDNSYVWRGRSPRRGTASAFDRRDGMTMTGLSIERPPSRFTGNCDQNSQRNLMECRSRVQVEITMQYRFTPPFANFAGFTGLFQDQYIHERSYKTTVFMRNWDVEHSEARDYILTHSN